jgi:glycosyltransferase involved in cell wall biosynthesis
MSDVLVSFVVPAFNEEALIASCLYSILAEISRSQCPAEIIVVNNDSTDSTRSIASSIPGVIVIDEPERGLVQARRAGSLAARGKLIANIDSDTMLIPGWLDMVLANFERSPRLVALSGPFIHYDAPRRVRLMAAGFYRLAFLGSCLMKAVAGTGSMIQGGNFVVSRSALASANAANPAFRFYGEDTEISCRLSEIGKVRFRFALRAYSSGRRLIGEGILKVAWRYVVNYMCTALLHRPYTESWLDFRHDAGTSGDARGLATRPVRAVLPNGSAPG